VLLLSEVRNEAYWRVVLRKAKSEHRDEKGENEVRSPVACCEKQSQSTRLVLNQLLHILRTRTPKHKLILVPQVEWLLREITQFRKEPFHFVDK
jgi:hypothetical protein